VNYFTERHGRMGKPDSRTAGMRMLKYPELPPLSGSLNWLTILDHW